MTARISRRQAHGFLAGAGVAIGTGVVVVSRDDGGSSAPTSTPPTTAVAGSSPADVALIGERYLEQHPDEAAVDALSAAVDLPAGEGPAFAALRGRIHADLEAGRVAVVDGWVLAVTEARLCALVALGA